MLFLVAVLLFHVHAYPLRFDCVGVQNKGAEEERMVDADLQELAASSSSSFWSHAGPARVLLTLRNRVKQVNGVMGMCHATLCNIYSALFPLDEQPRGIFVLSQKFSSYEKAKLLVRQQLVGGAKVALAIAKTHYPQMDFLLIARGPQAAPGHRRVSMMDKYEAAHSVALDLMLLAEEETEAELARALKLPRS